MTTTYPNSPYNDDFDSGKNFYRILFKPGQAVQARELTQLQTMLQQQIADFGTNIFKEGSLVIPGQSTYDNEYRYVKLDSTYSSPDLKALVGQEMTGGTTGVVAKVVNYADAVDSDPPTLFVKYLNSGSDYLTTSFANNELLTNDAATVTVRTLSSSATGTCSAFSVSGGVIFTKGSFVHFDKETLIIDKYTVPQNKIIGFKITESVITSDDDTSLLDPALGSSNYLAPGADRYSITLALEARAFTPVTGDDNNFVELIRIEDGKVISFIQDPQYNIIRDTLARRTYDESGDYVVRDYKVDLTNHLLTDNVTTTDGMITAANGGDDNKYIAIVDPGKAYVKGYEVDNINTQYIIGNKARDYETVTDGTVATTFGNFIYITNLYSVPDLAVLGQLTLYDRYNATPGTANGTAVGTARVRAIQYSSGTVGTTSAVYKMWLFDVQVTSGYTFERNVKQIFFNNTSFGDFTADVVPTQTELAGSVTTVNGSTTITGAQTKFTTEVVAGDYITINGNSHIVSSVTNDVALTVSSSVTGNVSGRSYFVQSASFNDTTNKSYLFELPYKNIKTIDSSGTQTTYYTRRVYDRSLSGYTVSINAGTNETFQGVSTDNYQLIVLSGSQAGTYVDLTVGSRLTRSGSPTGKTITVNLTDLGSSYSGVDVRLIATVLKQESAAVAKTKTLVEDATVDFTSNTTATAQLITLGKADGYQLKSVKMSGNAFGTAYNTSNEVEITDRYTFNNGQKITHYDLSSISLKNGQPIPTGPIRVTFDYFTHGSGDFFTVDSYADIGYDSVPTLVADSKTYYLRDYLDFRPRVNDAGTGFSGASASVGEFLDFENDVITEYQYYLPKIDKMVIDTRGVIKIISGVGSARPKEPATPQDCMTLFVFKQQPYVYDVNKDIEVISIDNRRYTMRDIGRIENRVKNLEYYTTLSLSEKETAQYQIKDGFGFDRFKNGFVVDGFNGHGIGDPLNKDYACSIDVNSKELRPMATIAQASLTEANANSTSYVAHVGGLITMPYTENVAIQSKAASITENVNPFDVITWTGTVTLDPPSDIWIDTKKLPTVYTNVNGNYDTLLAEAQAKGTYGTVWGAWRDVWYGNPVTDTQVTTSGSATTTSVTTTQNVGQTRTGVKYEVVETIDTKTNKDVIVNKVIIPKMRDIGIKFTASGLKPNTRVHVFFDQFRVTEFCATQAANVLTSNLYTIHNLVTDELGELTGVFTYDSSRLNLSTGIKKFAITDSPSNGEDRETTAETTFEASGQLYNTQDEVVSTRNAVLSSTEVTDTRTITTGSSSSSTTYAPDPIISSGSVTSQPEVQKPDLYRTIQQLALGSTANYASVDNAIATGLAVQAAKGGYATVEDLYNAAVGGNQDAKNRLAVGVNGALEVVIAESSLGSIPAVQKDLKATTGSSKGSGAVAAAAAGAKSTDVGSRVVVNAILANPTAVDVQATPAVTNTKVQKSYTTTLQATKTCKKGALDPLAQSFYVDTPSMFTKVDLYFYAKSSTLPVRIEIRKMTESGLPGPYVVPFSVVSTRAADVSISDDASVATTITFPSPVYLDSGYYAIVVMADTIDYKVWISEVGLTDIITSKIISKQPNLGSLFKSQNASTWSPYQFQDLKFNLYAAEFDTSTNVNVDLIVDSPDNITNASLGADPFEVFPGSTTMRIYHPNHGMSEGSKAWIKWYECPDDAAGNVSNVLYGIAYDDLARTQLTVSNVTQSYYTVDLPQAVDANVTTATRVGGLNVLVESDVKYSTLHPAIASVVIPGTRLTRSVKATNLDYSLDSSFVSVSEGDIDFSSTKVIPSNTNSYVSMSGNNPLTLRFNMSTTNSSLSPMIDLKKSGVILARNLLNDPSYSTENLGYDVVTIASSNTISFTKVTNTSGYVNIVGASNLANAATIVNGTTLTIAGSDNNNGTFRVVDVLSAGANILVYGNVNTAAAANVVTITNGTKFIAEEAPSNGSAHSKYITRQIDFNMPSTSLNLRLDTIKPIDSNIKIYYKTKLFGETSPLASKEFVEMTGITIPTSLSGEYYEIEKQVDNLPQFDAVVIKIVFTSSNESSVPKCRNLRLIALA